MQSFGSKNIKITPEIPLVLEQPLKLVSADCQLTVVHLEQHALAVLFALNTGEDHFRSDYDGSAEAIAKWFDPIIVYSLKDRRIAKFASPRQFQMKDVPYHSAVNLQDCFRLDQSTTRYVIRLEDDELPGSKVYVDVSEGPNGSEVKEIQMSTTLREEINIQKTSSRNLNYSTKWNHTTSTNDGYISAEPFADFDELEILNSWDQDELAKRYRESLGQNEDGELGQEEAEHEETSQGEGAQEAEEVGEGEGEQENEERGEDENEPPQQCILTKRARYFRNAPLVLRKAG